MAVAFLQIAMAGCSLLQFALAYPQFTPSIDTAGLIPASELPRTPTTATPAIPAGTPAARYDTSGLDSLWAQVEKSIPVESPRITQVVAPSYNFTVPKTPTLPDSLQDHANSSLKAPEAFLWGVATAAQQYEGAVKADGRGPSHWDYLCHRDPSACTNYTSDITDLGRYYYRQDNARIKAMGVNSVSLTISWSRVMPFGKANTTVNEAALEYYEDLLNDLLGQGITPVVTLFHWDDPLELLFEYGAFLNSSIVQDFTYYAEVIFKRFGNLVTTWYTFNEPRVYCSEYTAAPFDAYWTRYGVDASTAPYPCTYNVLKAHGSAVKAYRQLVSQGKIKKGEIAFKNDDSYPLPVDSDSDADQEAARRHFDFYIGIFSQPVYVNGSYPNSVRQTIPEKYLPEFTSEEKALIKGSADFYAIDAYRTNLARAPANGISACLANSSDPNWPVCQDNSDEGQHATAQGFALGPPADPNANWLYNTAPWLRYQLKTLKQYFNYSKIYISEFGFAEPFSYYRTELFALLFDTDRTAYYQDYLKQALLAIHEDGIPLAGVFAWSQVDNFEWGSGLNQRFGMQYVNYSDPNLERHYKLSFLVYRDFIKNHSS